MTNFDLNLLMHWAKVYFWWSCWLLHFDPSLVTT